ncbi:MAG: GreA/GreB family elongation factor [Syntrophomonadaceae bacterium]|nr:GreA/GreB family elongation factor [Syntrophomonadaceae bacterium]MDD4549266.1 GreA/GreB family elongation factor [Syntrophomonadaceae bacterium]
MGTYKFIVSKFIFELLVKHLVDVEELVKNGHDNFFNLPLAERKKYERIVAEYIKELDNYIKNTTVSDTADNSFPFVIVGSEVVIEQLDNPKPRNLIIVSPFMELQPDKKCQKASCFSPLGHGLLLKKPGDIVDINAPAGVYRYKINAVYSA